MAESSAGKGEESGEEVSESETEAKDNIRQTRCHHVASFFEDASILELIGRPVMGACCSPPFFNETDCTMSEEAESFEVVYMPS